MNGFYFFILIKIKFILIENSGKYCKIRETVKKEGIYMKGRHLELLLFLMRNKKATYKSLAKYFDVSTKTIERDISYLESIGIPVYCLQGAGGGVFIDPKYKLSKSFFTNEDVHNIVFALATFDSITGKSFKDQVLKKLSLISPELINIFESNCMEYFVIDLVEEELNIEEELKCKINHALEEDLKLKLRLGRKKFLVSPISYIFRPEGMYIYCYGDDYMLMKISSIKELEVTDIKFEREFKSYKQNKSNIKIRL